VVVAGIEPETFGTVIRKLDHRGSLRENITDVNEASFKISE
jgi:hypothetical protein